MSSFTINSNIAALGVQRNLALATRRLTDSFSRLSSGMRINRASADAAGLSVSSLLNTDKTIYLQGMRNLGSVRDSYDFPAFSDLQKVVFISSMWIKWECRKCHSFLSGCLNLLTAGALSSSSTSAGRDSRHRGEYGSAFIPVTANQTPGSSIMRLMPTVSRIVRLLPFFFRNRMDDLVVNNLPAQFSNSLTGKTYVVILFPPNPTQSGLVELLAEGEELTVRELQGSLASKYEIEVSLKNLYRIVAQLLESQMLVRRRGKIALNLVWVTHFVRYADLLRDNYLASTSAALDLPLSPGQQVVYSADSLTALDPLWNDTLLHLGRLSGATTFHGFNAHAWYALAMKHTDLQLFRGLTHIDVQPRLLFGHDTFLDQLGARMMSLEGIEVYTSAPETLPKVLRSDALMLWTAGDYVVESLLPEALAKHLSFYFNAIRSAEQFDVQMFSDIFRMRARCSLTITHDAERAKSWRAVLQQTFNSAIRR